MGIVAASSLILAEETISVFAYSSWVVMAAASLILYLAGSGPFTHGAQQRKAVDTGTTVVGSQDMIYEYTVTAGTSSYSACCNQNNNLRQTRRLQERH